MLDCLGIAISASSWSTELCCNDGQLRLIAEVGPDGLDESPCFVSSIDLTRVSEIKSSVDVDGLARRVVGGDETVG